MRDVEPIEEKLFADGKNRGVRPDRQRQRRPAMIVNPRLLRSTRAANTRSGGSKASIGIIYRKPSLEPSQIERPGSPSMTCWRSKGRSPGFQSDAVWTTR